MSNSSSNIGQLLPSSPSPIPTGIHGDILVDSGLSDPQLLDVIRDRVARECRKMGWELYRNINFRRGAVADGQQQITFEVLPD